MDEKETKTETVKKETARCPYCNKELPINEMVAEDVWVNHGRYHMLFCSKEHAAYYQMGAEG